MRFKLNYQSPEQTTSDCIVVAVNAAGKLMTAAKAITSSMNDVIKSGDLTSDFAHTVLLHHINGIAAKRVILINCGKDNELKDSQFQTLVQKALVALRDTQATDAGIFLADINVKNRDLAWKIKQIILIAGQLFYQFLDYKSKPNKVYKLRTLQINLQRSKPLENIEHAFASAAAIVDGMYFCKNLANTPPNICNPIYLAKQAQQLSVQFPKIKVQALEEKQIRALGMNALLSVGQGSDTPPRLIVLQYQGGKTKQAPVAFVGKGITFDTGGNTMKPGVNQLGMKFDMTGAASVLGTIKAAAILKLPINVVGIIASAENMVSGRASRPEDVIKTMSGQTVEINNTDAEGRLVLCDALTYCEKFKPAWVVDVATLTGAISIALGSKIAGLFTNDDALAQKLLQASDDAADKIWRMPLVDDYQDNLNSYCADFANSSIPSTEAGSILGAYYLSRFTKNFKWAHLDIAGVASFAGSQRSSTGRPVPLLTQLLINYAAR